jgi:hypothetical protein
LEKDGLNQKKKKTRESQSRAVAIVALGHFCGLEFFVHSRNQYWWRVVFVFPNHGCLVGSRGVHHHQGHVRHRANILSFDDDGL